MATGPVPGAVYPATPGPGSKIQTLPNTFTPPGFWGLYPPFSRNGQTSKINVNYAKPPTEAGPGYGFNGGQKISTVNASPAVPLPPQPPDTPA